MSNYERKKIIIFFIIGLILGSLIAHVYLSTADTKEFFATIESISLSFAAIFTALWTYRTFGKTELREEVQLFIEALENYSQAVNNKLTMESVYELLAKQEITKQFSEDSLKELNLRVERTAQELKRLYDTSTHIPDTIRVKLLLYGDFYFQQYTKEQLGEFNQNIFSLKSMLRKSVKAFF